MEMIEAANYTKVDSRSIDLLVIHDMEYPERLDAAEQVAKFFANQKKGPSGSSAHYNIDANSIVQSVRDRDVAWAAPGGNHDGLQFEHAGVARQTTAQWLDSYGEKMLFSQSAPLFAAKCKQYKIPPVFLRAPDLTAQKRGITTHWEITRAFSKGRGHTDPGVGFPLEQFMNTIRKLYGRPLVVEQPNKKPMPVLKQGMRGHNVKIMQRLLNYEEKRAWDDIKADGIFGSRTNEEVREFQKRAGLRPDGIVGKNTWQALYAARLMA